MLKIVIALVLLGHGIGHSMGILQVLKIAAVNPQWHGDSWILTGTAGASAAQAVGVIVWSVALVGFVLVAAIVMGWLPEAWFVSLVIVSSIASLAGIALFPLAFPLFSTIGALVIDVAMLAAVLWYQWVPSDLTA
jgi:hypothetical protein